MNNNLVDQNMEFTKKEEHWLKNSKWLIIWVEIAIFVLLVGSIITQEINQFWIPFIILLFFMCIQFQMNILYEVLKKIYNKLNELERKK